jgi:hypothetical protein
VLLYIRHARCAFVDLCRRGHYYAPHARLLPPPNPTCTWVAAPLRVRSHYACTGWHELLPVPVPRLSVPLLLLPSASMMAPPPLPVSPASPVPPSSPVPWAAPAPLLTMPLAPLLALHHVMPSLPVLPRVVRCIIAARSTCGFSS